MRTLQATIGGRIVTIPYNVQLALGYAPKALAEEAWAWFVGELEASAADGAHVALADADASLSTAPDQWVEPQRTLVGRTQGSI